MSGSGGTFMLVATYPDEVAAREDDQVVKDAHAAGLAGSYDAAAVTKEAGGKVHQYKDETATRHGAVRGAAAGAAFGVIFPPAVLGAAAAGVVAGAVSGHRAGGCHAQRRDSPATSSARARPGSSQFGENKVDAIRHAVTRAEKRTAQEPGVDPEDTGKTRQETV
jgi:hypothetical protein